MFRAHSFSASVLWKSALKSVQIREYVFIWYLWNWLIEFQLLIFDFGLIEIVIFNNLSWEDESLLFDSLWFHVNFDLKRILFIWLFELQMFIISFLPFQSSLRICRIRVISWISFTSPFSLWSDFNFIFRGLLIIADVLRILRIRWLLKNVLLIKKKKWLYNSKSTYIFLPYFQEVFSFSDFQFLFCMLSTIKFRHISSF